MNFSNLIFILIVFGFTFLSWLFGKIREQAEVNRIRQERARQREEALRTGRGGDGSEGAVASVEQSAPPTTTPDQLAQQRQAQLRALREQQLQRMRQQRQRPAQPQQGRSRGAQARSTPPTQAPSRPAGTSAPPYVDRSRKAATQQPQQPRQTPGAAPGQASGQRRLTMAEQRVQQRQAFAKQRRAELQRREEEARRKEIESARRRFEPLATPVVKPTTVPPTGSPKDIRISAMSLGDWRRAIVISEVIAPPVSLRPSPGEGPTLGI